MHLFELLTLSVFFGVDVPFSRFFWIDIFTRRRPLLVDATMSAPLPFRLRQTMWIAFSVAVMSGRPNVLAPGPLVRGVSYLAKIRVARDELGGDSGMTCTVSPEASFPTFAQRSTTCHEC